MFRRDSQHSLHAKQDTSPRLCLSTNSRKQDTWARQCFCQLIAVAPRRGHRNTTNRPRENSQYPRLWCHQELWCFAPIATHSTENRPMAQAIGPLPTAVALRIRTRRRCTCPRPNYAETLLLHWQHRLENSTSFPLEYILTRRGSHCQELQIVLIP